MTKLYKPLGLGCIVIGAVLLFLSGTGADTATALIGGVFTVAALVLGAIKASS